MAALYVQAQSTVEQLKAVELENYFQDECVHLLKSKQKDVQDVDAATAVVYMIPLADRTEILLSFKDKQYFRATSKRVRQLFQNKKRRAFAQYETIARFVKRPHRQLRITIVLGHRANPAKTSVQHLHRLLIGLGVTRVDNDQRRVVTATAQPRATHP